MDSIFFPFLHKAQIISLSACLHSRLTRSTGTRDISALGLSEYDFFDQIATHFFIQALTPLFSSQV